LRALPESGDGVEFDLDPSQASAGFLNDETVQILAAKFVTRNWKRKDGTIPEGSTPDIALEVSYRRAGDGPDDRPFREQYKYGNYAYHLPSVDGNKVSVRASALKPGQNPPQPRKTDPGVLFLSSIKNAGGSNIIAAFRKDGAKALAGLTVQVRRQRVEGMSEKAKDVLLVDFISGVATPAPSAPAPAAAPSPAVPTAAAPVTVAAPAAATPAVSGVNALAEEALLDILSAATNGTISRSQIATTLIRIEKWKAHADRGAILKALRDDAFFGSQDGVLWTLAGNDVTKL
jgi:hypothetical protein